jgi:hypothetical protein
LNGSESFDLDNCTGLQFKCNEFSNNSEDIRISDNPDSRIRIMQGTPHIGTGNRFINSTVSIRNASSVYRCFYAWNVNYPDHKPQGIIETHYPYTYVSLLPATTHTCPDGIGYQGSNLYFNRITRPLEVVEVAYKEKLEILVEKKKVYNTEFKDIKINWKELKKENITEAFLNSFQVKLFSEIVDLTEGIQLICNEAFDILISADKFDRKTYNTWLLRENKLYSGLLLAQSYTEQSDLANAQQTLNDLRTRFPEFKDDNYDFYLKYLHYQQQFDNRYPLLVTQAELLALDSLYLQSNDMVRASSRALIEYLTGTAVSFTKLDDECKTYSSGGNNGEGISVFGLTDNQKSMSNPSENLESFEDNSYSVSIYPNPFNDVLQIRLDNATDLNMEQVSIYDISGRKLRTISGIGNIRTTIQLSDLSTGMYFIHVSLSNGETKVERIVKQ